MKRINSPRELTVYLPEEMLLDKLKLDIGAGEAKLENISARRVSADVGAGQLYFSGEVLSEVEVECGAGEAVLELEGNSGDYNYRLECIMGEIEFNGKSCGGVGVDQIIDNGAERQVSLECGMGRIELNIEE